MGFGVIQGGLQRVGESLAAVPAEARVDGIEPPDEVLDFAAGVGSAGRPAKMGAASERARLVNGALPGALLEQRAAAVGFLGEALDSLLKECLGGYPRFTAREVGHFPREPEPAAFRPPHAGAFHGPRVEGGVHFPDGGKGFVAGKGGLRGFSHGKPGGLLGGRGRPGPAEVGRD